MEEIMKEFGCGDRETQTFFILLAQGSAGLSVSELSKKTGLPRPTLYGYLDMLIEKGLVRKEILERGGRFFAQDPLSVNELFKERVESIKLAQKSFQEIVNSQNFTADFRPRFSVFDTNTAAEQVFRDVLRARDEQTYWFWPARKMLKNISQKTLTMFMAERVKRGIWLNVLWPDNEKVDFVQYPFLGNKDSKKSLRKISILPSTIKQSMGYGLYGSKVAFISTKRENYAFIIESKELYATLKNQFDYLWSVSKKYS